MTIMCHATAYENLCKIMREGIKRGCDGVVYMCKEADECARFLYVRKLKKIVVFKIRIPKKLENKIIETFDHSYEFFQCRAYGYCDDISVDMIEPVLKYEF